MPKSNRSNRGARTGLMITAILALAVVCSTVQAQGKKPDPVAARLYSVALGFQRRGLFEEAARNWQQFIKTYPEHSRLATAHHHLGVCQIQLNAHEAAKATFQNLLKNFPKFASHDSAQFNLGLAYYNAALDSEKPQDYIAAAGVFEALPKQYAKSALIDRSVYYRAECLSLAGQLEPAVGIYRSFLKQHGKSPLAPQVQFSLAATLQDLKKLPEATASLQVFLKQYPKDPLFNDCRLRLGVVQFDQKRFDEAAKLFAAVANVKGFAAADLACLKHARSIYEQKKIPQAAGLYESLPKRFPKSELIGAALLAGGKCRYQVRQLPQAEKDFLAVLSAKVPQAEEASLWLGRTLIQGKKSSQALRRLDAAIKAFPKGELRLDLAFARIEAVYAMPRRQKEAVKLFAKFATDNAKHDKAAEAVYRAAFGSVALKDLVEARRFCDTFLSNAEFAKLPLAAEVLLLSADSNLQSPLPNPAKAEAQFRQLVARFPQHRNFAAAQVGIGGALYAQKKLAAAIEHFNKSAATFSKDPDLLAESRLLIGRCHLDARRAKEAVTALRSALAANGKWEHADEVLYVLGVGLRSSGETNGAIAELQKLNSQFPKSNYRDQALQQLGGIYHEKKRYPEAIAHYQKLIAELPKSNLVPAALYGVAAAHFAQNALPPAIASLDLLLGKHAKSPLAADGRYLRGMARLRLKQFQPALADLQIYLATKPSRQDASAAQFAMARCQLGLKQLAPAISSLAAIVKSHPEYGRIDDVYYELAFAYLDAKNAKQAADTFVALTVKRPKSPRVSEAFYRIGEFHENAKRPAEAAAAYAKGLQVVGAGEVRERLFYKTASLQFKGRQFVEADKTLQAQLKEFNMGPLAFAARFLAAECLYRRNDHKQALARFTEIINSTDPKAKEFQARAGYRGGTCAGSLKDWPTSQRLFSDLIAKFPKFEQMGEARYGIAIALQNQEKLAEARAVFKQVTDSESDTVTAAKSWFMMGQCWFAEKKYQEAIDCFSQVAFGFKHDEWQPLSYFEAGRCYLQLKKVDSAKKMLGVVVKEFSQHPRAKEAKAILRQLEKR